MAMPDYLIKWPQYDDWLEFRRNCKQHRTCPVYCMPNTCPCASEDGRCIPFWEEGELI